MGKFIRGNFVVSGPKKLSIQKGMESNKTSKKNLIDCLFVEDNSTDIYIVL